MKHFYLAVLILFSFTAAASESEQVLSDNTPPKHHEIVWCSQPAKSWFEAMPLGNGRLGAMIPGNIRNEIITLNDDTLWSGEPRDYQRPDNYKVLPEIRQLLFEGKHEEAQKRITDTMTGPYNESYQPLGNLTLTIPPQAAGLKGEIANYRRELDLKEGTVKSRYTLDGVPFEREAFASFPDDVLVFQVKSNTPEKVSLDISLSSLLKNTAQTGVPKNRIVLVGNTPSHVDPDYAIGKNPIVYTEGKGMKFMEAVHVVSDGGTLEKENNKETGEVIQIRNATTVRIYFTAKTSFVDSWTNPASTSAAGLLAAGLAPLDKAVQKPFDRLNTDRLADYQSLYNRVKLTIAPTEITSQPMEQRLRQYSTETDPQLAALYYQFGRYLLISGSRPGSQPMNLQGIWNKDIHPAWSANWTMNCNAEINYWGAETANLSELVEPFVRLTKELTVDGSKTAKNLYNARGWVTHHNIDLWRTTYPVGDRARGALWAVYQVGGAWACQPVYDHYLYTGDKKYLAEVYPVLKGAALFFLDTLQEDPNGYLTTNPSISFENVYRKLDGSTGWASYGGMQEIQIVRATLRNTLEAAKILGEEKAFQEELAKTLKRLPPNKVSPTRGDLQEWFEDWEPASPDSGGGQLAHGWALNPDWDISPITTPELAAAFRKTLEIRKPWTRYNCSSWIGSMAAGNFARLLDGQMVETILDRHIKLSLKPSLVSTFSVGGNSWQNDSNLGMMSAIGEMLLQSRPSGDRFELHILPALMPSWKSGKVEGLCARGGFTVDIIWSPEDVSAVIHSTWGTKCRVRFGDKVEEIDIPLGEAKTMEWKR
ncbi:alpha/beta hydrolase [Planctomycetales bacterium]|nr:alpha/beta hydrolase [Planctomycetales bacterium]